MADLMMGLCARNGASAEELEEMGLHWLRAGTGVPFEDRIGGRISDRYKRRREQLARGREQGLHFLGTTPNPGVARNRPDENGRLVLKWQRHLPEWFGEPGSDRYYRCYEDTCAFLADDLHGIVEAWQIGNELDWKQFAGPLNGRQACDYIMAGARGLKASDPSLTIGPNPTTEALAPYFWGRLYAESDGLLDYCGIDRYFGSWNGGGPRDWAPLIEQIHELTGVPVLVNEWSYSSAGGVITEEDRRLHRCPCESHNWPHVWGGGHTPEVQADYIREATEAFRSQLDHLLGLFWLAWADWPTCWQCGEPDCPVETAWGLIDHDGCKKPSYYALKDSIARLQADRRARDAAAQ